ncbi:MAG: phosphatidate cytidylyltransferase, partial [Bacteroidota bacterium]|nr:phosphatidate cytidylyltransferase [Bacteroidota bacterium]
MALDSKAFKTRSLTAVVFVIVMLAGLLWNQWSFIVLFTIIHFGCWYEFIKLLKKINPNSYKSLSLLGLLYISLPIALIL